jgi:hypothetical protein
LDPVNLNSIGGLSENADDSGFLIAFLHSIIVWRVRNARHEAHPRVTVASDSKSRSESAHLMPEMTKNSPPVTWVWGAAHVAGMPLDQHRIRSRLSVGPNRQRSIDSAAVLASTLMMQVTA